MSKDFKKKKEHAGKKRPAPDNYTNTRVKQSRLVVRQQRAIAQGQQEESDKNKAGSSSSEVSTVASTTPVAAQKSAVTHRGLGIDDLLSRLNHASAATRQEAVHGIRELATDSPDAVAARLGLVLERLAQIVPDPDRGVRSALRLALASVLDSQIAGPDAASAAPFMPLLIAYVASSLTHALDPIRVDAVAVASLLLDKAPVLTRSYAPQLILRLGSLLANSVVKGSSDGAFASANTAQGSNSIGTIGSFGRRGGSTPQANSSDNSGTNKSSAAARNSYAARVTALNGLTQFLSAVMKVDISAHCRSATVIAPCVPDPFVWDSQQKSEVGGRFVLPPMMCTPHIANNSTRAAFVNAGSLSADNSLELLNQLRKGLTEVWAESVPFREETSMAMRNVVTVIDTLLAVARPFNDKKEGDGSVELSETARNVLSELGEELFKILMAQFPLSVPSTDEKLLSLATSINVLIISVITRVLPELLVDRDNETVLDDIVKYLARVYRGYIASDVLVPESGCARLSSHQAISIASTLDCLPVILEHCTPNQRTQLRSGFCQFFDACVPASTAKQRGLVFVRRLVGLMPTKGDLIGGIADIVSHLPKLLWQLKNTNLDNSELALDILLLATKYLKPKAIEPLQNGFVPFLFTVLKQKPFFGPFIDLSEPLQQKAVSFISSFPSMTPSMERALLACAFNKNVSQNTAMLLVEALERFHTCADPSYSAFGSICATALVLACSETTDSDSAEVVMHLFALALTRNAMTTSASFLLDILTQFLASFTSREMTVDSRTVTIVLGFLKAFVLSEEDPGIKNLLSSKEIRFVVSVLSMTSLSVSDPTVETNKDNLVAILRNIPVLLPLVLTDLGTKLAAPSSTQDHEHMWKTIQRIITNPYLRTPNLLLSSASHEALNGACNAMQQSGMDSKYHQEYATLVRHMQLIYV